MGIEQLQRGVVGLLFLAACSDSNDTGFRAPDPTATTQQSENDDHPDTGGISGSSDEGGGDHQCDPLFQGCPQGEKCSAYGEMDGDPWNANKCVPVMGDKEIGEPCQVFGPHKYTGLDDCDKGSICMQNDADGEGGVCVAFCEMDLSCNGTNDVCQVYQEGSLPICLTTCDPLAPVCPEGQGCYSGTPLREYFVCYQSITDGMQGESCASPNACTPGLICIPPDAMPDCSTDTRGCCTRICDLSEDDPCEQPLECIPYFSSPLPDYEQVGACVLP